MHANPYSGCGFFGFFATLAERLFLFFTGESMVMAPDEIQLAVLSCSAIACGLIGPFLVLKKMSMFANSLSHTSLLGIVVAYLFISSLWGSDLMSIQTLLVGAVLAALLTAGLTEGLSRLFRLQEDASIGLVFTALFAFGILLVSVFMHSAHLGIEVVTGNCDALQLSDLRLSGSIVLLNALVALLFYRRLQCLCFDESFFRISGFSAFLWRNMLFLLTSLTCIASFRAVGVLVVLALLVGPYLTARLFCHRLRDLLFWTPACGVFVCLVGVALSRAFLSSTGVALSTGGFIALTMAGVFILAALAKLWIKPKLAID